MHTFSQDRIQTVGELTRSIRGVLEVQFPFVAVAGEISNLRCPLSGHLYFTLKDASAQIKAVLFKTQQRYLSKKPEDGLQVVCRGRVSLYEPRGEYQLIVDSMETRGTGNLQLAFEQLKQKLSQEGLFAQERKKPLPMLPEKISLITSPQGAALHDFLKIAGQRFPSLPIEIVPVRVQGAGALEDILDAIELCNKDTQSEVIVLCRGGGSLEDLWTFNEEKLAKAISQSRIPVVAAIGHEVDFTIADLVADFRAPTPSAAAEAIIPSRALLHKQVKDSAFRLSKTMNMRLHALKLGIEANKKILGDPSFMLDHFRLATDHASAALQYTFSAKKYKKELALAKLASMLTRHNPEQRLEHQQHWVSEAKKQLIKAMALVLSSKKSRFTNNVGVFDAVSPLAVLARGYSIARHKKSGKVIRSFREVHAGENVSVILHEGTIDCEVTGSKK